MKSRRGRNKQNPPMWAEWFIRKLSWDDDRDVILENLREEYQDRVSKQGKSHARRWYCAHMLKSVIPLIGFELIWRFIMFNNYLKIALRYFKRHRIYSSINIAGLAIGLTCCILIFLYVQYELSYDKFHKNADDIYRVVIKWKGDMSPISNIRNTTPGALKASIAENFPEVLKSTRAFRYGGIINKEEKIINERNITYADPEFLDIFTYPLLSGDSKTALNEPFSILLTSDMADKYFGVDNPMGKLLNVDNNDYKITGILENTPKNSHYPFDFLASFNTLYTIYRSEENINAWNQGNNMWNPYILLPDNHNPAELEKKLLPFIKKYMGEDTNGEFLLQALTSIHLHSNINHEIEANGDIRNIYIFSAIAFFIMLIACLNYMNLSTARSSKRAKEIGVRKVVGANREGLVKQLISESLFYVIIAFGISIVLVKILLPLFNSLIDRELEYGLLLNVHSIAYISGLMILVGFISGSYPAFFLSSFKPLSTLRGTFSSGSNRPSVFRNTLVIVQFSISVVLIVCTIVMFNQMNFIKKKDLGFSKDHIIYSYGETALRSNFEAFKNELIKNPKIREVYTSGELPITILSNSRPLFEGKTEREEYRVYCNAVDYNFLEFFNIEVIQGRGFSKEFGNDVAGTYLISETFAKMSGWKNPIGKKLNVMHGGEPREVIGVFKDFHNTSLHLNLEPMALYLSTPERPRGYFAIKINSDDIKATLSFLEEKFIEFSPDYPFSYTFLDERVDRMYKSEQRLGTSFNYFSFIALFIACLGMFGLASFAAEQKIKEIGIRKVFGASVSKIVLLLLKKFILLVVLANIIAWPLSYYAMNKWLQNFAYKVNIDPGIFFMAGFLALIIALFTVGYQALKAATANPVEALRNE